ncbi:hypothetical protein R3I94_011409 [Phoxinus phoxinus]
MLPLLTSSEESHLLGMCV